METTNSKNADLDKQSAQSLAPWLYLPAASFLLIAALLKVHQLATSPLSENLLFDSRAVNIGLIIVEISVAIWLFSCWRALLAKTIASFMFGVFLVATITKFVNGEASCGCFGVFAVPPLVTAIIDSIALGCLLLWKPIPKPLVHYGFITAWTVITAASIFAITNFKSISLDEIGTVVNEGEMVVIEPEKWIGKQFPLANLLKSGSNDLRKGEWKVILYHEDCPKCQALIKGAANSNELTAFIEIPPFKSPTRANSTYVRWLKLSDEHDWFVSAPAVVILNDGVVSNQKTPAN